MYTRTTSTLPTEIISYILKDGPSDPFDHVKFAVKAASISKHWRTVALATPDLWATFALSVCDHSMRFLTTFLARSNQTPLSIALDVNLLDPGHLLDASAQRAIRTVRRNAHRTRTLEFRITGDPLSCKCFLFALKNWRSSTIKTLKILLPSKHATEHIIIRQLSLSWPDLAQKCPNLTHLEVSDFSWIEVLPGTLTHLSIIRPHSPLAPIAFSYVKFASIIQQIPHLQEFVFDGLPSSDMRNLGIPVHVDSLQSMTIHAAASLFVDSLLKLMITPNLRSLSLPNRSHLVDGLHANVTYPHLTSLYICASLWNRWLHHPIAFPALERLQLFGDQVHIGIPFMIGKTIGGYWITLRTLDMRNITSTSWISSTSSFVESLSRLLKARHATNAPKLRVMLPATLDRTQVPQDLMDIADIS